MKSVLRHEFLRIPSQFSVANSTNLSIEKHPSQSAQSRPCLPSQPNLIPPPPHPFQHHLPIQKRLRNTPRVELHNPSTFDSTIDSRSLLRSNFRRSRGRRLQCRGRCRSTSSSTRKEELDVRLDATWSKHGGREGGLCEEEFGFRFRFRFGFHF